MNKYTLGVYEKALPNKLSWREKLSISKEIGYDFLEISIDESDEKLARLNMTKAERVELLLTMSELEMPIRTMCLSGHRKYPLGSHDENIRKKSLEIMEKAIALADDLGIRIIQLAGYDVYYEESDECTRNFFESNLRLAVEKATAKGIILAFETMETPFMDTVEKSFAYVKKLNSPYLMIYPDIGNLKNASLLYDTSVLEDLNIGRGYIAASHLKETKPGIYREVPYGEGHVEFIPLIHTLWEQGVRRYVTELWCVDEENWKIELTRTHNIAREMLERESLC